MKSRSEAGGSRLPTRDSFYTSPTLTTISAAGVEHPAGRRGDKEKSTYLKLMSHRSRAPRGQMEQVEGGPVRRRDCLRAGRRLQVQLLQPAAKFRTTRQAVGGVGDNFVKDTPLRSTEGEITCRMLHIYNPELK